MKEYWKDAEWNKRTQCPIHLKHKNNFLNENACNLHWTVFRPIFQNYTLSLKAPHSSAVNSASRSARDEPEGCLRHPPFRHAKIVKGRVANSRLHVWRGLHRSPFTLIKRAHDITSIENRTHVTRVVFTSEQQTTHESHYILLQCRLTNFSSERNAS
jgi:hypothetical protein